MTVGTRGDELNIEARRAEVAKLTHKGWSTRRIAAELGCSHATVARDVDAILTELAEHQTKDAEKIRARELETLATAEVAILKVLERSRATESNTDEDGNEIGLDLDITLRSVDRLVKVQERRAKLLGLDAPERLDATVTEGPTPESASRLVREVFAVKSTHEQPDERGDPGAPEAADDSSGGPVAADAGPVPPSAT